MKSLFFLNIFLSSFVFAAEPVKTVPSDMPAYEGFQKPIYSQLEEKKEKPKTISESFFSEASKISQNINRYLQAKRSEIVKLQVEKKKEFELLAQKEIKDWRAAHPKESAGEVMKAQVEKRKELASQLALEKKQIEEDLKNKKTQFDKFMEETKKDFKARYNSYLEAMKLKEDPVQKEFKEIPKGPGTVLAPDKAGK